MEGQNSVKLSSNGLFDDYKKMSKLLIIVCGGLLGVVVCLSVLLLGTFPLKKTELMLVKIDSDTKDIVEIKPIKATKAGHTHLLESLSRDFVKKRESFDLRTEDIRFPKLLYFMSKGLQEDFMNMLKGSSSVLHDRHKKKVTRSVEIVRSHKVSSSIPDLFQVEWRSQDVQLDKVIATDRWVSTLKAKYAGQKGTENEVHINPAGFEVYEYKVVKKENLNGKI